MYATDSSYVKLREIKIQPASISQLMQEFAVFYMHLKICSETSIACNKCNVSYVNYISSSNKIGESVKYVSYSNIHA